MLIETKDAKRESLGVSGIAFICRIAMEHEMNQSVSTQTTAKPLGLILVAVYTGIWASLYALMGVVLMVAIAIATAAPKVTPQWWAPIFGFALLLAGVLAFAAAYGLWERVSWGYSLARLIYIVFIPLDLVALLADRTAGNVILQLASIALAVWILVYLAKPEIKGLFRIF